MLGDWVPPTRRRPLLVTLVVWKDLYSRVLGPASQPEGVSRVQVEPEQTRATPEAVSYTHLTLPTKRIV